MPFHLAGWSVSQDSAVLAYITALADQVLRIQGNDVIVPTVPQVAGLYFIGPNLTQAQIVSPSIRQLWPFDLEPIDRATTPSSPPPYIDLGDDPLIVQPGEAMDTLASEDAAGASRMTALAWFADGPFRAVQGNIFTIRATATATLTAYAWTNAALTLSQSLPVGTFDLVGMRAESAGLIAARAVFIGGGWRPGIIGQTAVGRLAVDRFRYGRAGQWGTFDNLTPPSIDFLSSSADTSETVWLDLIKRT